MKEWLGQRPRFHVHFTPTYASWINQVERWFGIINQNAQARLLAWVATAESILAKIQRLCHNIFPGRYTREMTGTHIQLQSAAWAETHSTNVRTP